MLNVVFKYLICICINLIYHYYLGLKKHFYLSNYYKLHAFVIVFTMPTHNIKPK